LGIFHFSPKLHIFSTKRLKDQSLGQFQQVEISKFQLLGNYMNATPFYHLALVSSNCQLRVKTCGWGNLAQNPYFGVHTPKDLPYTKPLEI
jgi:hypothetical protein